MTIDNLMFLAVGVCVNGFTFALGVAVGLTFRKDSDHDSDNDTTEADPSRSWHLPLDIGTAHSPQLRSTGGAQPQPKAHPAERPAR